MKKWVGSAVIYLLVVMGVYMLYTQVAGRESDNNKEHQVPQTQETSTSEHKNGELHGDKNDEGIEREKEK